MSSIEFPSVAAELSVIADAVDRYGQRITDIVQGELPRLDPDGRRDDLLSAVHEAERSLRVAHRALTRAQRLASAG